jgi:hypothetical protein
MSNEPTRFATDHKDALFGDLPKDDLERQIGEIEDLMKDRNSIYYQGSKAKALQTKYRELIDMRDSRKDKKAPPHG